MVSQLTHGKRSVSVVGGVAFEMLPPAPYAQALEELAHRKYSADQPSPFDTANARGVGT